MKSAFITSFLLFISVLIYINSNSSNYISYYPNYISRKIIFNKLDIDKALFTYDNAKNFIIHEKTYEYFEEGTLKYKGKFKRTNNNLILITSEGREIRLISCFNTRYMQIDTILQCQTRDEIISITMFQK